jgi:hypothetical protein
MNRSERNAPMRGTAFNATWNIRRAVTHLSLSQARPAR